MQYTHAFPAEGLEQMKPQSTALPAQGRKEGVWGWSRGSRKKGCKQQQGILSWGHWGGFVSGGDHRHFWKS